MASSLFDDPEDPDPPVMGVNLKTGKEAKRQADLLRLGEEAERKRQEKEAKKKQKADNIQKQREQAGLKLEKERKKALKEKRELDQKKKDEQIKYAKQREHRRLAAERRGEIKKAQADRDSSDSDTDSSKFNIFGVYFFPWILLVLAIIQVRQLPKPSPQDTSTEQNERKLVYAQTLLSSLMVLAASQRTNQSRSHVPAILALFLVVASGMGAGMSSNSTIQGISGGTCALAICTGIAFHRHANQGAPGWAITKVAYNLLEQIEAMPGINVIVLAGLLFWTIIQMADLKFAYPSTDAKVEVWYPDEQKPKTSEYKAARALELVLVSLIFIATFARPDDKAHWLTKLTERISWVVGTPGRRNMVLMLLLAFCGVYMFIYNGYESFAIDSALLGLALVSSSSHTMTY